MMIETLNIPFRNGKYHVLFFLVLLDLHVFYPAKNFILKRLFEISVLHLLAVLHTKLRQFFIIFGSNFIRTYQEFISVSSNRDR